MHVSQTSVLSNSVLNRFTSQYTLQVQYFGRGVLWSKWKMGAQQSSCKDDAANVTIESVEKSFEADETPPSTNQCVGIDADRDDLNSEGTFNVDVMSDWARKKKVLVRVPYLHPRPPYKPFSFSRWFWCIIYTNTNFWTFRCIFKPFVFGAKPKVDTNDTSDTSCGVFSCRSLITQIFGVSTVWTSFKLCQVWMCR